MKNQNQINDARNLAKMAQDYVVLAQTEGKLKILDNKDAVSARLGELTKEIGALSKNL